MSGTRVLVVASSTDADSGYVGERLQQRSLVLDVVMRDHGELPVAVPADAGALLLLGSEWSVAAPVDPTALEQESRLVRSAGSAGLPVLGLCYGAQVLAHAYGGRVAVADQPEVGLVHVDTDDPGLVPAGPWWAFHLDVIEPPRGGTVVARNACGVQAFTLGRMLGVQFHPEVLPDTLDDWARRFPHLLLRVGVRRDELVAKARRREQQSRAAAHALVDAFLEHAAVALA